MARGALTRPAFVIASCSSDVAGTFRGLLSIGKLDKPPHDLGIRSEFDGYCQAVEK